MIEGLDGFRRYFWIAVAAGCALMGLAGLAAKARRRKISSKAKRRADIALGRLQGLKRLNEKLDETLGQSAIKRAKIQESIDDAKRDILEIYEEPRVEDAEELGKKFERYYGRK